MSVFFTRDLMQWVKYCLHRDFGRNGICCWSLTFDVVIWTIWCLRKEVVFNDKPVPILILLALLALDVCSSTRVLKKRTFGENVPETCIGSCRMVFSIPSDDG